MENKKLTAFNLLPQQQVAYHPHLSMEEIPNLGINSSVIKPVTTKEEPKGAQMTIFYAGEIIVLDNFPADKAKDIMSFARKEIHKNYAYTFPRCHTSFSPPPNTNRVIKSPVASHRSPFPFNVNVIPNTTANDSVQEYPQAPSTRPVVSDLPLARKASLHRFLEKRKDRIAAKAPYQTSKDMSWLALAPKSPQDKSESSSNVV